jgi:hypothetical protein
MGHLAAEYSTQTPGAALVSTRLMTVDALGSTRVTTDAQGGQVARFDYYAFGQDLATSGRTSTLGYQQAGPRLKFTGKERDAETAGLLWFSVLLGGAREVYGCRPAAVPP